MAGISTAIIVARILYAIGFFLFIFVSIVVSIWIHERNKIASMPRIPMMLCDKHGSYPASASLHISAPAEDKPDLTVEICPVCYEERLQSAPDFVRKLIRKTNG